MNEKNLYEEKVSSKRTEALFIVLTLVFLALGIWRVAASGWQALAWVFFFFAAFFLFYVFNYQTLVITITSNILSLKFGVFTWDIPVDNIAQVYPDDISLYRIGGAGIHFTSIAGRYRAMFNFLEYPRLVIKLKQKHGPVKDIVFSTRRPEEIERMIAQTLDKRED